MKVRFDEIPAEGKTLTIADLSWFPDQEVKRRGNVVATVYLKRDGKRVFMDAVLSTVAELVCDRCLELFALPIDEKFQVGFELDDSEPTSLAPVEYEIKADEMDTVFLDEPVVDIYEVLQQQVFLALPERSLCNEDCRGLCSSCGANLNMEKCRCGAKLSDSPFSVLAGLKDIKK